MFNVIYEKTSKSEIYKPMPHWLKGLFIGGRYSLPLCSKNYRTIYGLNERQILFMAITGLAFTCMITARGEGIINIVGRFALSGLSAVAFTMAVHFAMNDFNIWSKSKRFGVINKQGTLCHKQSIYLFLMLCGLNYMGTRGFECMANFVLSSEMASAAGFVMASLVSIYPSKDLGNNAPTNASTISGLMGFVAFTACAGIFKFTRLGSFKHSMLFLKAIPIFLACTEAIYEEKYEGEFPTEGEEVSGYGKVGQCTFGSAIITTAFVGGDLLTTKLCSTGLLNFATELALTPVIVIGASLVCRSVCNFIGEQWATAVV